MTQNIEMQQHLISPRDVQAITGVGSIMGVVVIEQSGRIFADIVMPIEKRFFRVTDIGRKDTPRSFKAVDTAIRTLMQYGFPEITIKIDRDIAGPDWLHVPVDGHWTNPFADGEE